MRDNPLFALLRAQILAGLARFDVTAQVKQNFQPTTQGVDSGPTLYFHKIGDKRYGYPQTSEVYDADQSSFVKTTRQNYETTMQITASAPQTAADTTGLTASDLASVGADVMQDDETRAALLAAGVSVLRIANIRGLPVVDGEGQFEDVPSFDFVLKHERVSVTITPAAIVSDFRTQPV